MKNSLFKNYLLKKIREYIFIFCTATIFFLLLTSKGFTKENIFIIDNVEVEGAIDLNFSREKYIDLAFKNSFKILMNKILVEKDYNKIRNMKLNNIKKLISSFKIKDEKFSGEIYKGNYEILFNEKEVKRFLGNENISFFQPQRISAVFYPIIIVKDEIKIFNNNFFYNKWMDIEITNNLIDFILPIENVEDLSKISKKKNRIEELNVDSFVNKYNLKDYVFALMSYEGQKLNIHLKTNFNQNKISKNISYDLQNIENEKKLFEIGKSLKIKISDLWKEENIINLAMPLTINIEYKYSNLKDFDKLKSIFSKISIIDNFYLDEFNIKSAFFEIYYYGNPKKLSSELLSFGYELKDINGHWNIIKL